MEIRTNLTLGVDLKKLKNADPHNGILGVHVNLELFQSEDQIIFRPTEAGFGILHNLQAFQEQGFLEPTVTAPVEGRLSFTLSTTYAIVGRAEFNH
jgi:hypothetical protein